MAAKVYSCTRSERAAKYEGRENIRGAVQMKAGGIPRTCSQSIDARFKIQTENVEKLCSL
jgi:hypothetical protein